MHLLLRSETGKYALKSFRDDGQIPPYAILSHTWGLDIEEVTFEDIVNSTGKDKPGYEKIQFCGEQASQDDLRYFWVDTCCINKKNHAELARSIRSMFRWYRNATQCYVYLSDVSSSPVDANNEYNSQNPQLWELEFQKSRWFTRGWTLQELLAPASVKFFSWERKPLGDKSSLVQQIQEITNIPSSALQGDPLSQFSRKERLQWIEHRDTELAEDKAYSLIGIFDVYILPIYGEGFERALARLEEEFSKMQKCIQDLRLTDPRDDKKRIEDTKGGLLDDSYYWILENSDFQQWRNNQQSQLLWIKGDPGKGKTMLLCGITNELKRSMPNSVLLSYFFCQATDSRINNATAVLRGLIFLLVTHQPSLILHTQTKYDQAGKTLFEDANAWVALSDILTSILQDPNLDSAYLIIDGLDECITDLPKLLDFVVLASSMSRVKWIVSSRNWPTIDKQLSTATGKLQLCLELNEKSISTAITKFIDFKVDWLATRNKYSNDVQDAVNQYLTVNANNTFLWVALVCQELSNLSGWRAQQKLTAFPPGLNALYQQMIDQIGHSEDAELCKRILAVISTIYRPITLHELVAFVDMPEGVTGDYEALSEIIGLCGSFLTLREHTIFFVHQSAKDFLLQEGSNYIFPSRKDDIHYIIFSRSLQVMSSVLLRDIYKIHAPGISIDQVKPPKPDPLAIARYSCLYWVEHLLNCDVKGIAYNDLIDGGSVYKFLYQSYLYWLEALSVLRDLSSGIVIIRKLENLIQAEAVNSPNLYIFLHDTKRFALYNRSVIEQTPLQVYCSALVFAPKQSIVRAIFEKYMPLWIKKKPKVQTHWSSLLQTLEGHTDSVTSVAFSPNGKQVVSGSYDNTVRLWDAATGQQVLPTLEGHTDGVTSVAFSPDGKQVVSGSRDYTVRLWDAAMGQQVLPSLEGHTNWVLSVAFSPDGKQVVSGSEDHTIRLWDAATGQQVLPTLEGHTNWVLSVAFSPNGKQVVSGSRDYTVRLWDAATGQQVLPTLEGHTDEVNSVAFSPNGKQVVSGSTDHTVRLWDAATGQQVLPTLEGHTSRVKSVAFSPDGKQVVSGSDDHTVRLWDAAMGQQVLPTLEGHTYWVNSVAFSPDGKQVVSGSTDNTVGLWDAAIGQQVLPTLEGHTSRVNSVAFSPDGKQVVSGSDDHTVRLWDAATGQQVLPTLEGHTSEVYSVAFSPDGKQVVSGSWDNTVRLWDAATGQQVLPTLECHTSRVYSVAFSPDGRQVVSGSADNTVRLWDAATGQQVLPTLEGHTNWVLSVAFSPNGKQVVSGSWDNTVRLWDAATGQQVLPRLEGHTDGATSVAFSPDGKQVVSGSWDNTVRLWDAATGQQVLPRLEGHTDGATSVAFSPDGKQVVSKPENQLLPHTLVVSNDWIIKDGLNILWLPPEYRTRVVAIWGGNVVLALSSGKVLFLEFS